MPEIIRVKGGVKYTCKPNASGVYYVHWTDGRRSKRASTHQREASLADAALDEWLKFQGTDAEAEVTATCADVWLAVYGDKYRAHWRNLDEHFGPVVVTRVTDELEAEYIARRRSGRIGTKPAAPSSITTELALLRASWSRASKAPFKIIPASAVPQLPPLPEGSPPRTRWLRPEELQRLFDATAPSDGERMSRLHRFLWIARETAARRNAIETLTWAQVDFDDRIIHFNPEGRRQTSKRRASVPMSDALFAVLERAHLERESDYVLDRPTNIGPSVYLLTRKLGMTDVSAHTLRHTAATYMARSGVSLWIIAQVLGNSVAQVERTYAKYQPDFARPHMNTISQMAKKAG